MATAIAGTVTPSLSGGSVLITLGTPPAPTGGAFWYIYWKGRGETNYKRQPARYTAGVLSTKIPIPSQRGQFYVQCIDSTGTVFVTPVTNIFPKGGTPGAYIHMIQPEIIGYGASGQGAAKAMSYTIGDGKAVTITAPVVDLTTPLGSGLTLTGALSTLGNVKNFTNSAASVSNEGIYLHGIAY